MTGVTGPGRGVWPMGQDLSNAAVSRLYIKLKLKQILSTICYRSQLIVSHLMGMM